MKLKQKGLSSAFVGIVLSLLLVTVIYQSYIIINLSSSLVVLRNGLIVAFQMLGIVFTKLQALSVL